MSRRSEETETDIYVYPDRRKKDGETIYSRSRRKVQKITDDSKMHESDLVYAKSYAVILRAARYSFAYISDNLGIANAVIKKWFDEPDVKKQLAKIQKDMADGAVVLLQSYAVEGVEMLMEIARRTSDHKVAIQAITEVLDRGGVTKVNKSESTTTQKKVHEHDLSEDFFERLEGLPIETQSRIAEMAEEMNSLIEASRGKE